MKGQQPKLQGPHLTLWRTSPVPKKTRTPWRIVINRKVLRLATARNRWKRQIREVLRRHQELIPHGDGIVVVVRSAREKLKFTSLEKEIVSLLRS